MSELQVTPFMSAIDSLSHARHLSFMQRTDERSKTYLTDPLGENMPANFLASVREFRMAVSNEDYAYKTQQGSDLTPRIKEADDARDTTLSGIRTMCDALCKIGTDEQKTAAAKILKQIDVYKLRPQDSYEDEGIKLDQMCHDFTQNYQLTLALRACGLEAQVTTLKQQNDECRRLVNQRNEERSYTDGQAMNKARKATDAAYADMVLMLNAYNVVSRGSSNGQYEQCIQVLNADIDYYKQWVLRKNGGSEGGDTPDEGGDTPTPSPTPEPTPEPSPEPEPAPDGGGQ